MEHQEKESAYTKSPWRWACLALAALSGLCLAYRHQPGLFLMLHSKTSDAVSIGVIGGADGPTSIFVTGAFASFPSTRMLILWLVMGILGFIALRKIPKK